MASSSSARAHRTPIPVGTEHLVAGAAEEVDPQGSDVGREVGGLLGPVDQDQGPGGVGRVGQVADGVDGAEHVGHGRHAEKLGPVEDASRGRERSRSPSPVSGRYRSSMPRSAFSISQGTRLA